MTRRAVRPAAWPPVLMTGGRAVFALAGLAALSLAATSCRGRDASPPPADSSMTVPEPASRPSRRAHGAPRRRRHRRGRPARWIALPADLPRAAHARDRRATAAHGRGLAGRRGGLGRVPGDGRLDDARGRARPVSRRLLSFVVAVSGACVLAVEIAGTRILGPFYGVSLFLWSALIGVTLAALAVGYALGGRWADRGPTAARLAALLAAAGAWLAVVPFAVRPVLALGEPFGLRASVLVSATLLFFPPLLALGMVSPYAIRLRARSLDEVGRVAGDLYAISTVASVAGAIATGFWLIPTLGTRGLILGAGSVLLATAALVLLASRRGAATAAAALALFAGAAGALAFGVPR